MAGFVTYFVRENCRWTKVATSVAKWARLPHAAAVSTCKVSPLALALMLGAAAPAHRIAAPPRPVHVRAIPEHTALPLARSSELGSGRAGAADRDVLGKDIAEAPLFAAIAADDLTPLLSADATASRFSPLAQGRASALPGVAKTEFHARPAQRAGAHPEIVAADRPMTPVPEPGSLLLLASALGLLPLVGALRVGKARQAR